MSKNKIHTGAVGESIAITELLWHGWAPVNINAIIKQAPNVDILAAKNDKRVALQIKTAGTNSRSMLRLDKKKLPVFNDKEGPKADFVVFVRLFNVRDYECYVVPILEAERVIEETAKDWKNTLKKNGAERGDNFPFCIRFELNRNRPDVSNYRERWSMYRDAWQLLEEAIL